MENDLPDTLKISEARKRDAASAAKKAAASKSAMNVETEEQLFDSFTSLPYAKVEFILFYDLFSAISFQDQDHTLQE